LHGAGVAISPYVTRPGRRWYLRRCPLIAVSLAGAGELSPASSLAPPISDKHEDKRL